jgi:hypothetical protein
MPPDLPELSAAEKNLVMHVEVPITAGHVLLGRGIESMHSVLWMEPAGRVSPVPASEVQKTEWTDLHNLQPGVSHARARISQAPEKQVGAFLSPIHRCRVGAS